MVDNSNTPAQWRHFSHQADIGVQGEGATLDEAFAQAALALTAVVADPHTVRAEKAVPIHCEAPDSELLLVDWLNALIYEMAVRKMLFSRFEVSITDEVLEAKAWGEALERQRHQPAVEIKGATYTALEVRQLAGDHWRVRCVVDV